jgi:hypothetical protein
MMRIPEKSSHFTQHFPHVYYSETGSASYFSCCNDLATVIVIGIYLFMCINCHTTTPLFIGFVFIGFVSVALHVSTRMGHLQVLYTYNIEELLI